MTMCAGIWHKKTKPPIRKPREKATPIIAMPLPLVEGVETSVTIAVDKETFPADEVKSLFDVGLTTNLLRFHPGFEP